ncbi:MAG: hypothetical protein IH787_06070 [Nitrospirae bacterium]|nr:hypothetical protein [Nitrospirota bacterium]
MSNDERRVTGGLSVDPVFHDFVESELLPAIGFDSATFWGGIEAIVNDLTPVNRELLRIRDDLQTKIDQWHQARAGSDWQHAEYVEFLTDIGYLKSMDGFPQIETENVDAEIAEIAGPQLVVPVSNARFAINAANARWGSLYDALYGSDVIGAEDGLAHLVIQLAKVLVTQGETEAVLSGLRKQVVNPLHAHEALRLVHVHVEVLALVFRGVGAAHCRQLELQEYEGAQEGGIVFPQAALGKVDQENPSLVHQFPKVDVARLLPYHVANQGHGEKPSQLIQQRGKRIALGE